MSADALNEEVDLTDAQYAFLAGIARSGGTTQEVVLTGAKAGWPFADAATVGVDLRVPQSAMELLGPVERLAVTAAGASTWTPESARLVDAVAGSADAGQAVTPIAALLVRLGVDACQSDSGLRLLRDAVADASDGKPLAGAPPSAVAQAMRVVETCGQDVGELKATYLAAARLELEDLQPGDDSGTLWEAAATVCALDSSRLPSTDALWVALAPYAAPTGGGVTDEGWIDPEVTHRMLGLLTATADGCKANGTLGA